MAMTIKRGMGGPRQRREGRVDEADVGGNQKAG
jgi:hypothetical protein